MELHHVSIINYFDFFISINEIIIATELAKGAILMRAAPDKKVTL